MLENEEFSDPDLEFAVLVHRRGDFLAAISVAASMERLAYFRCVDQQNCHCVPSETEKNHVNRPGNIALIRSDIRKLQDGKS
jgi:hypothetical protein